MMEKEEKPGPTKQTCTQIKPWEVKEITATERRVLNVLQCHNQDALQACLETITTGASKQQSTVAGRERKHTAAGPTLRRMSSGPLRARG